jgi:YVTN family beta-propeller protein
MFLSGKKETVLKDLFIILLPFIFFSGCQAALLQLKAPLEEEGEVYLYINPFPQEADRLRFKIVEIIALSGDGREFPLSVSLHEFKGPEVKRQRFLASGQLPPGPYVGFSFKVKDAILKVEEGEATLLVPETPARIDFPFNVAKKKAYVISLIFKYRESIRDGFSFSPVFSIFIPTRPITSLMGFVTNYNSHNITVFDKNLGQAVAMIATGRRPAGMALDQTRRRAYVALSGDDMILVVDVTAVDVTERIRLNTGDHPQELAVTPDGKVLLSANTDSNTVSIIDPISLLELSRINVGKGPNSVLMDPTGRRAYVFNRLSSTISVIDIPNKAIVTTISTDPGPLRGQFNRRGDRFYVINEWSSYLTVFDAASLTVVGRFTVARVGLNAIRVDRITDFIYLGRRNDRVVEVYDPFSFVPVDFVQTVGGVTYMTIDGETNYLYMVSPDTKSLIISNLISKKMISEIDVGDGAYWVTLMGER